MSCSCLLVVWRALVGPSRTGLMIKCEWTVFGSRQVTPKLWPPASNRWPSALKRQASAFDHKPWPAKHQSWCVGVLLQTFGLRPARVFSRPVAFGLWPSVFSLRPWVFGLRQTGRSPAVGLCRSSQRAYGLLFFAERFRLVVFACRRFSLGPWAL